MPENSASSKLVSFEKPKLRCIAKQSAYAHCERFEIFKKRFEMFRVSTWNILVASGQLLRSNIA